MAQEQDKVRLSVIAFIQSFHISTCKKYAYMLNIVRGQSALKLLDHFDRDGTQPRFVGDNRLIYRFEGITWRMIRLYILLKVNILYQYAYFLHVLMWND